MTLQSDIPLELPPLLLASRSSFLRSLRSHWNSNASVTSYYSFISVWNAFKNFLNRYDWWKWNSISFARSDQRYVHHKGHGINRILLTICKARNSFPSILQGTFIQLGVIPAARLDVRGCNMKTTTRHQHMTEQKRTKCSSVWMMSEHVASLNLTLSIQYSFCLACWSDTQFPRG